MRLAAFVARSHDITNRNTRTLLTRAGVQFVLGLFQMAGATWVLVLISRTGLSTRALHAFELVSRTRNLDFDIAAQIVFRIAFCIGWRGLVANIAATIVSIWAAPA